jgi:ABC-type branched-subunit amino acid transport system ATPase component
MTDTNSGLSLRDVRAGYRDVEILRGITLKINPGETVAVLGSNGCGKSTLAKTLMGLANQTSGQIEWNGRDISSSGTSARANLGFGYVPQVRPVFGSLSVHDNLLLCNRRKARRERQHNLDSAYQMFPKLYERRRISAGNLSGGERRMLGLASVVLQDPKFLILDEPTSDLSPVAIDLVLEKIVSIRSLLQIPILLIEQNVRYALELGDRVCVLVRGEVAVDRRADKIDMSELAGWFLEQR